MNEHSPQDRKVRQFSLAPSFVAEFEGRQPKWGPVGYFTFKRTYARPTCDCDDPRSCGHPSEEFWEACRRVVEGVYNVQKAHCRRLSLPWNEPKAQQSAQDMFQRMWEFKWTPPGRGLWMMGTPFMLQKGGACINNCFSAETRIIVEDDDATGIGSHVKLVSLGDLAEFSRGERPVKVQTKTGIFKPASARSFGVQKLVKVSFAPRGIRSNYRMEYDVTPNHRWILADGSETTTLKVGDTVKIHPFGYMLFEASPEGTEGFAHGLVFGDGSQHTYYPERHQIRLCGEKEQKHVERLERSQYHHNTTHPESYNGDAMVWFNLDKGMNWKALPPKNSNVAYQRAFLHGWIAADGTQKPAGTICLNTQNHEAAQWLIERAPLLGFCVIGFNYDPVMETNYGPRSAPMARITLTTEVTEYVVKSITDEGREEEVFCVTEPETGTFTLEGGLVTGNCAFVSSEHIDEDFAGPFTFLMDMSMLGVGVGGDTRGAGKVKIQTPKMGENFPVADSREGWVVLAKTVLNSFVGKGAFPALIDFSAVRPKGKRIRGFGGTASGAGPLAKLMKNIARTLAPEGVQVVFEESFSEETGEVVSLQTFFVGEGKPYKITSSGITDIFNMVGACVVAGGVRRSAEIMFGQPDDQEFRTLKDPSTLIPMDKRLGELKLDLSMTTDPTVAARVQAEINDLEERIDAHPLRSHRWASNNSIFGEVGMDYAEVAQSIAKNGEPGILWLKNAQDFSRMKDPPDRKDRRAQGANPCFAGDTLIAVADGRGAVPIQQLVEEGNDVPVYSVSSEGHVEIKMARRPRMTREFASLVEIELDDGTTFKVTPDHKMRLLDGTKCEAKDLQPGDSLPRFTKRPEAVKKGGPQYLRVYCDTLDSTKDKVFEHRLVAQFHDPETWHDLYDEAQQSGWIKGGLVVHHRDYNPLNNSPENLEIMTFQAHAALHGQVDNAGEKNPMWGKTHTAQTRQKIGRKTSERCSDPVFLAKLAASHLAAERAEAAERLTEQRRQEFLTYYKEQEALTDLDTVWVEGRLHAVKTCETCQEEFIVPWRVRGQCYCTRACMNKAESHIQARKAGQAVVFADKQRQTLHDQVQVFKNLEAVSGVVPRRKDWEDQCRREGVPTRFRKTGTTENPHALFGFSHLQQVAADYNHRVVAVRFLDGGEPVFNLSVEDNHTVGVVTTFDPTTKACSGVFAFQCVEQTLESFELCTLVETYPAHHDSYEDFQKTLKVAYLYAKTVTLIPTHDPRTNAVMNRNRRIGCSMSGIRQAIGKFGRREFLNWCDRGYSYIHSLDTIYSEWLGIPLSIKTTSVKPSGCRPWYALTTTNQGLLTLEDIFENHPADQEWADAPDGLIATCSNTITKTYNNGVAPVVKIVTSYGIEVESTPNHQWWVFKKYDRNKTDRYPLVNEWRRADELEPGDILDVQPGVYMNERPAPLVSLNSLAVNMRGDAIEIQQPSHMNPRLAWFLGYLWGDGAMSPSKYRLRWVDARRDNLEKVQAILKENFGLDAEIHQASSHRKAETLEVGSKHLWHWLIRNDVFKLYANKIDIIPKVVRCSAREDVLAFLAGLLDADGWAGVTEQGAKLVWTTADPFFAKHVQDVALAVGLVLGRSHITGGSSFQNRRSMYHLTQGAHVNPDCFEAFRRHSTKAAEVEAQPGFPGWHCLKDNKCGLILGKVLRVEPVGEMPTYDVEVAETHWYYAGAVRSHNTVSLLCGATPGIHPPHSPFYIRNIRVSEHSPLCQAARDAGYKVEKDSYADATWVISFPVKTENCTKGKRDVSIWEQVALAADMQRHWADNQVSVTVTFSPEEAKEIGTVLEVFEDRLKSISFLPLGDDHGYVQAPYIEITEDEYIAMEARVRPMVMDAAKVEQEDKFCDGGACQIDFSKPLGALN